MEQKPKIYSYFNYRYFCRDWYLYHKKNTKGFTYHSFAESAGLTSLNYFQRIVSGKRNLSEKHVAAFGKAMSLTEHELTYLKCMLQYDTESNSNEKIGYLKKLLSMRKSKGLFHIQDRGLKYLDKWWYPIIRELATLIDFQDDYYTLANSCIPRISESQAQSAIRFLEKNNYLSKDKEGRYFQETPILSTGDEAYSLFVRKYHRDTIEHGCTLLDKIKPEERDVSSLTFSVSEEKFYEIKEEIQAFRKKLMEMIHSDEKPAERVYSAAIQLFPRSALTKKIGKGKK